MTSESARPQLQPAAGNPTPRPQCREVGGPPAADSGCQERRSLPCAPTSRPLVGPADRAGPGECGVTRAGGQSPGAGPMAAEQDPEGRAAARPLLTDLYQATMALGYWRAGRAQEAAEFELFFRRCPFGGAFALAAGLRDCVRFLRAFRLRDAGSSGPRARPAPRPAIATAHHGLSPPDVQFLASVLPPDTEPAFFEHLRALDCSGVTVRALPEGSLAFPGVSAGRPGAGAGERRGRGRGSGAGGAKLTARPAGTAAAGVRAAPGGAAAGDAAPLPGQLRQVGPLLPEAGRLGWRAGPGRGLPGGPCGAGPHVEGGARGGAEASAEGLPPPLCRPGGGWPLGGFLAFLRVP